MPPARSWFLLRFFLSRETQEKPTARRVLQTHYAFVNFILYNPSGTKLGQTFVVRLWEDELCVSSMKIAILCSP